MRITTTLLASLLTVSLLAPAGANAQPPPEDRLPDHVPGEVVVGFDPGAPAATRRGVSLRLQLRTLRLDHRLRAGLMKLPRGLDVADAVEALEEDPAVSFAEPNYIYSLQDAVTPNDPHYPKQWALGDGPGSIDAPDAWAATTGSSAQVIAVVDTGVDRSHPDLSSNMWVNPGEIPNNGIDDDLNGYIDDVHGYDWAEMDSDPDDELGHGTHVSGIAAARGNDSAGVAGTAWDVRIMALRALNDEGAGTSLELAQAFTYAARMGARVVNASVGGPGYSLTLERAIEKAPETLFVAASGNGGSDGSGDDNDVLPTYPCSYPQANVVCVAASNQQDALASFSNYGNSSVDIAAPGTGILSTLPGNRFAGASGTSMAAPFVSGVAALLWSAIPQSDISGVRNALLAGAERNSALQGKVASGGRLSAFGALAVLAPQMVRDGEPVPEAEEPGSSPSPVVEDTNEEVEDGSLDSAARVLKKRGRLRVKGWVAPGQRGPALIKVVLKKRRAGRFHRVARQDAALDLKSDSDRSVFRTGFRRPHRGRCRLITRFRDDETGEVARTRSTFRC